MSWGHAVSKNLLTWLQLPVALTEENGIMIFSGSAVVDSANTSGFGKNSVAPLVAVYTGNSTGRQTQNIAYSTDHGRTWAKYVGNPVIDIHSAEFRDPMAFWHSPSHRWVMVVSLAKERKVRFYSSPDLKTWRQLSDFGPAGAVEIPNWECPNIFPLPVANASGRRKWVLVVGVGDGGPAGGSATQYFVGEFDGTKFVNDNPPEKSLWIDYGADFYAAQTWSDVPSSDGRRIMLAWMNDWRYADKLTTRPWRGQMMFPRTLGLLQTKDGIRLTQAPVHEIESIRDEHIQLRNTQWTEAEALLARRAWPGHCRDCCRSEVPGDARRRFRTAKGASHETRVGYNAKRSTVYINRTHSGDAIVSSEFRAKHEGQSR
jgi:fructan beta-fructosidase